MPRTDIGCRLTRTEDALKKLVKDAKAGVVPEEKPVALPDLNVRSRRGLRLSMNTIGPVSDCLVDPLRFFIDLRQGP